MNPNEYLDNIYMIEPIYETEPIFLEPFWEFKYRFQSLHRNWELNKYFLKGQLEILEEEKKLIDEDPSAFDEIITVDIEYFPIQLRASTISLAISFLENLLADLSEEVANDLNIEINLDKRPLPYINKYLLWLVRGCGLEFTLSKENNKRLDAIREVRNRFIHRINRDLPIHIKKTINKMVNFNDGTNETITNGFVDAALIEIAELVKKIEIAYWEFNDDLKKEPKK